MRLGEIFSKALDRLKGVPVQVSVNRAEMYMPDTYRKVVMDYINAHLDKSDGVEVTLDDVYVVWCCKTLKNYKCLVSSNLIDGMYYELTYNGDKDEIYLDAYKKFENRVVKL